MPTRVTTALSRLFSIYPGEEKKTLLLYSLNFVFWLGLRWGDLAGYALFINDQGAAGLATMFIGYAALAFIVGLIYSSFAGRVGNERLLLMLMGATIVWLGSVQAMLLSDAFSHRGGLVYPYFYLASRVVADLTALHMLNYISDYYDTRAAKRALPFLLSAGFAGAIVAGLSIQLMPAKVVPLAWSVCLLAVMGCVYAIQRWMPGHVKPAAPTQPASHIREGSLANLRAGFRFVSGSGILRWLALSTLALVVLMNLLTFQSSQVLGDRYAGDPDGLKAFTGNLDWIANLAALILPAAMLGPMLARLGVGATNFFFPSLTLLSIVGLGFFPNLGTAVFGRLTDRIFKKAFRNPVDAMLYNSVPPNVKSQARGFINGLVVPVGTLAAGLIVQALRFGWLTPMMLAALGLAVGLAYVLTSLRVRTEYARALATLLAEDEFAIFRSSHADFEEPDPATIRLLEQRLRASRDDNATVFLAEMLYDFQGQKALGVLQELAAERSPSVRASIIQMLGSDWISQRGVRRMCLDALGDNDVVAQQAAAALANSPDAARDRTILKAFLALVEHPDEAIQSTLIPTLIASGDARYCAPAERVLSDWITDEGNSQHRALGLRVLARTGDAQRVSAIAHYASDPAPNVRLKVAELLGELAAQAPKAEPQLVLDTLRALLCDGEKDVRVAAVNSLGQLNNTQASRALLLATRDASFEVRRQACAAMRVVPRRDLEQALNGDEPHTVECAAYVLARAQHVRAKRRAVEHCEALAREVYALQADCLLLREQDTPGARVMQATLQERASHLVDRIFWLVSALSEESTSEAIQRSLRGEDAVARANAAETLEVITTPRLAQLIGPLLEGADVSTLAHIAQEKLGRPIPTVWQVCEPFRRVSAFESVENNEWIAAISLYTLMEALKSKESSDAADDEVTSRDQVVEMLRVTAETASPLLRETARLALARLDARARRARAEETMTVLEEVIFLKQVPFFQEMSTSDLRVLAGISEEATYEAGQQIIAQGKRGDALYVIVSGRVAIQRRKRAATEATLTDLATLGPRNYFAEMSLFDDEPHSADAIALTNTHVILVRRAPLMALIKRQPDLAISLFKVLSQRLRQANAALAKKQKK